MILGPIQGVIRLVRISLLIKLFRYSSLISSDQTMNCLLERFSWGDHSIVLAYIEMFHVALL